MEGKVFIKYVKNYKGARYYKFITHNQLNDWYFEDFVNNGMFESLKDQDFVHLYFDFDFHSDDEDISSKVNSIINTLDSFKELFGRYYFAGYCCSSDLYKSLDVSFKKCIELKNINLDKVLSFHVVFPETKILQNELCDIMTPGKYNNSLEGIADKKVYKHSDKEQLLRHPYAHKYITADEAANEELKGVNFEELDEEVLASKLVATCKGSEKLVTKEQWLQLFPEKPVQLTPTVKFSAEVSKLLLPDAEDDDIAFGGEEIPANNNITKEIFELLYKGFINLEIHGDEEKTDKEITLFPLMSGLYSCVGKDGISEADVRDALDVIRGSNDLTANANKKWLEKRKQAENNKDCRGPGALFNYLKHFNPEYYTEHILPAIRSNKSVDVGFDLKDTFSIKDIRDKGAMNKYQVNGDEEKLDYAAVLNDLRRVMIVVDKADAVYVFKERDAGSNRMSIAFCHLKVARETLKQLKVGTELKKEKVVTKTAWDVFDSSANNSAFYKRDITFYSENPDDFSFFQGYKYDAVRNDSLIEKFNHHIRHIWCKDNEELYTYVQSWFATILQHPLGRCYTAIVVKGVEGTGKNAVTDVWAELLSGYANSNVSDIDSIVGKFNTAVENKKLLVCNEMDSADMNSTAVFNRLKKLITENVIDINTKNISVRTGVQNVSNYVFVSNEFNPVKISSTDRRYCILTPSEEVRGDFRYFEELFASMKDGRGNYKRNFMEAVMYYYMNYKVTVNLRNIPETLERVIARESNKGAIESFVEEYCLELAEDGLAPITCYDMFCNFAARNGFKSTYKNNTFKAEMTRYCEVDADNQLHRYKKKRVYRFTDAVRKQFAAIIKMKQEEVHDSIRANFDLGDSDSDSDVPVKGTIEY